MAKTSDKHVNDALRALERAGFNVAHSRNAHLKVTCPGKAGMVVLSHTGGKHGFDYMARHIKNVFAYDVRTGAWL